MTVQAHMNATPSDLPASEVHPGGEQAAATPAGRTIKRTFTGFSLPSVFRFGSAFYLSLAAAWLVGTLFLFFVAQLTGVAANIEGFVQESGFEGFRLTWLGVFKVLFLTGAFAAVVLTALTLLSAYLFNRVAQVFGGIEMRMIQNDEDTGQPGKAPTSGA